MIIMSISLSTTSILAIFSTRKALGVICSGLKPRLTEAGPPDEDPTTWLDNGRRLEEMLTQQNAIKVEYGPSPDLRFGCTLTVDLQRRILEVFLLTSPCLGKCAVHGRSNEADKRLIICHHMLLVSWSWKPVSELFCLCTSALCSSACCFRAHPGH